MSERTEHARTGLAADPAAGDLRQLYATVLRIRRFEEQVFELFGQNLIPGTLHLYIGQEAVAAGVCQALAPADLIQSTHRGHGHCLAKGANPAPMLAELLGKATGCCGGKGGSMHITDVSVGMLGATGVVASGLPLAVGAALSAQLRGSGQVVACFFGDGATNNGVFHEALNLAALWRLPVVFVCENNRYAMGTPLSAAAAIERVADRAAAYGMPGAAVDGNDARAVLAAARVAVARARAGAGPSLLECETYRHHGHSRFDAGAYRPPEEVARWLARDPVDLLRRALLEAGLLDEDRAAALDDEVRAEMQRAARFALESPDPEPGALLRDVFAE